MPRIKYYINDWLIYFKDKLLEFKDILKIMTPKDILFILVLLSVYDTFVNRGKTLLIIFIVSFAYIVYIDHKSGNHIYNQRQRYKQMSKHKRRKEEHKEEDEEWN